jgi:hypothetical protein
MQGLLLRVAATNKASKKKKAGDNNQPLAGAPTTVAIEAGGGRDPRGDKHPRQVCGSNNSGTRCPVHKSVRHNVSECREIKKPTE